MYSRKRNKEDSLEKGQNRIVFTALLIALLVMLVTTVHGQVDQGRIEGKIKDVSGGVVPGVTVKIKNDRTGEERSAVSNEEGDYTFNALRPSTYSLETSMTSFAPATAKNIEVLVGQTRTLDLKIRP